MVKDLGNGNFQLWTKDGTKALGPVTTKEKAWAQERAILAAQAKRARGGR